MSATARIDEHPIFVAIADVAAALSTLGPDAKHPLWTLTDRDLPAAVSSLLRLAAQVQSVLIDVVGEVDSRGVATSTGASSTGAWLRARHRVGGPEAYKLVKTASVFRSSLPATRAALAAGEIHAEHAHVIGRAAAELPDDLHPAVAEVAEEALLADALENDPVTCRRLSRSILTRIDPDGQDARDGKRLADAERKAARNNHVETSPDGDGGIHIRGRLDADGKAIFDAALQPLMNPRGDTGEGPDLRSIGQRRAEALVELCRRALAHGDLPSHAGFRPQVVVTIPLKTLTEGTGVALLPDGTAISPAAARHWACDAGIISSVLDGHSRPVDVTDERRLFEGRLRRALELRDGGCTFPDCDRPLSWCEAHHIVAWADGGKTNLANGVMVCRYHHRLVEQGDWKVVIHTDGLPIWHPPPWIDVERRPRRNRAHRPDQPRVA